MHAVKVKDFFIGKGSPLALISGPCVLENEDVALTAADFLSTLSRKLNLNFIFKSSYDKANRLSSKSFRGPGLQEGLRLLEKIKNTFNIPILTDVHTAEEVAAAAEVCDVLQIPAFLCRQTDLIVAAAATGRTLNIKKGQFLAPWDMRSVADKATSMGNQNIILTERGYSFGYNNLICDMRSIPIMQALGYPVCFDATHAVQLPGGRGSSSGGQRQYIPTLSAAAIAAGCDCLFMEAHPNPEEALSDKDTQMPLEEMEKLLVKLKALYELTREAEVGV